MLEFGKLVGPEAEFPPLLYRRILVPSAQILTLFSSPVTLFPATPGKAFVIERGVMTKTVGTAYTIGGAGNYSITAGALNLLGPNAPAGIFDQATIRTVLWQGFGQNGVYPNITLETQLQNVAITFQQATANMTLGTCDVIFSLYYRVYDSGPLPWS